MNKLHKTLYKTPEFIKLFIIFILFYYFLFDILPVRETFMEKIGISILCGLEAGIITAIYKRPIDNKEN